MTKSKKDAFIQLIFFSVVCALWLVGCARDVKQFPTNYEKIGSNFGRSVIRIDHDQALGLSYERILKGGSEWVLIGKIPQGNVFKPLHGIFTVEGAHVHEANLVLDGKSLVGFYLLVERAFVPLATPKTLIFTEGR